MDNLIIDERSAIFFYFLFMNTGTPATSYYVPKCYIGIYLMDMVYNFDFLNQKFLSKNYPFPQKTDAMASICKIFKQSLFC